MKQESQNWFVFYTKSRHEKKVRDLLVERKYEVFLPLQKVMRQWTDRKKKVEVPLFNSYIFVRTVESAIIDVLNVPGVSTYVRYNGKPAILREAEFDMIHRFLTSGIVVETMAWEQNLLPGDKAEVIGGPLSGVTGLVTGTGNEQKLTVLLEGINQLIRVDIDKSYLRKVM